ncbi:MAG: PorP/SprF family type IX secretion system membrane protein [Bacteroidales bacterium]|nr:PorP/SprF family type IX secretion system membrane protein [Bacteroidales bacterium]
MQKAVTLLFIFFISVIKLNAQQEYQVSQFMYDHISINPGASGSQDMACVNGILRQQWTGIEGAPQNIIIHATAPFRLFKKDHGFGVTFVNDKLAINQDNNLGLSYAYRADVGDGKLGIGAGLHINFRQFDNTNWYIPTGNDYHTPPDQDDAIPKSLEQANAFDFSFGLFYRTDDLYFGISATHINQNSYKFVNENSTGDAELQNQIFRHYYITSGYTMQLANPSFELTPSLLIQSDGKIHKIDINAILSYNKKFWGGVSFRPGGALIGMIGFEILNGAKIGFAYDFPVTDITNYYDTSYEVLLNYCFKIGVDKTPQKYKSIRFL